MAHAINQSNQALAGRTKEQATSLQETASNMDEVSATVKQNIHNAISAGFSMKLTNMEVTVMKMVSSLQKKSR